MRRLHLSPLTAGGLLALLGINAVFVLWIAHTLREDSPIVISTVAWTPDASSSLAETAGKPALPNAYREILARPIFFRDRRPYVAPPPPLAPVVIAAPAPVFLPPPPIVKPDLIVSGIALIGDAKQAYLGSASNPNGIWAKEGEDVMGWQVRNITSGGVTISKAGQSFVLLLYEPAGHE
jgi:hypothetical protein